MMYLNTHRKGKRFTVQKLSVQTVETRGKR